MKHILAPLLFALALPVLAAQPAQTAPPDDPTDVQHPPELTPEAKKALDEHCAKEPTACQAAPAESPAPTRPLPPPAKKALPRKPKN